ncbi:MAG TPA: hypothetical protein DCS66_24945 [Flavobacteriaceae bacterium]|nr:hypothetical protein [Flavobacteriaceae bacterium]|tara:strand:+ start:155 stop:820 length:666 start_codon:yes stop_codon:yes gene_type:complete
MKKILILILVGILSSCSNPTEKEFDKETIKTDLDNLVANKELDKETRREFLLYIWARQETQSMPKGIIYSELLSDYFKFQKCEDLSCIKIKSKVEEIRLEEKRLDFAEKVTIALVEKDVESVPEKGLYFKYQIGLGNKSGKELQGIKVSMTIRDKFNVILQQSDITFENLEKLNDSTYVNFWYVPYDADIDNDQKVRISEMEDLNINFDIENILYKDGSLE